jgi:hypothetical protein
MPPKPLSARRAGKARRTAVTLVSIVVLACVSLVLLARFVLLSVPASYVTQNVNLAPAVQAVHGSLRRGEAALSGGYLLSWNSRTPLWPLPHLRSDFTLTGPDSRLTGTATAGLAGFALSDTGGRAGPGLAQLVPGAWDCDMTARVDGLHFAWTWRSAGAAGRIETPAGRCTRGERSVDIPALNLALDSAGNDARARLTADGLGEIATLLLRRDRVLEAAIAPAAAQIFQVLPSGGPINLQLPF